MQSNYFGEEFERFCCISSSLDGIVMKTRTQILGLTNNCFNKSNITINAKWNQILHFFTGNRTLQEDQCHMLMCYKDMTDSSYAFLAILIFMFTVIVCSNLLVIMAITKYAKLRNNVANLFILSLAFSDLFVGISVTPIKIKKVLNNMHFCMSEDWCKFHITTDNMFFSISITNLLVIAIDRYIALHHTYAYPNLVTKNRVKFVILITWIYGTLWGSLSNISLSDSGQKPVAVNSGVCEIQNSYYIYSVFGLVFMTPVIVMGTIYIRIFLVAKHHAYDIVTHSSVSSSNSSNKSSKNKNIKISTNKPKRVRNRLFASIRSSFQISASKIENSRPYYKMIFRASKTVATVYGTFVLVWSPVCIISFVYNVCQHCFQDNKPGDYTQKWYKVLLINFLPLVSSMANPFIYAILNKEYRKAFKRILLRIYPTHKFEKSNDRALKKKDIVETETL